MLGPWHTHFSLCCPAHPFLRLIVMSGHDQLVMGSGLDTFTPRLFIEGLFHYTVCDSYHWLATWQGLEPPGSHTPGMSERSFWIRLREMWVAPFHGLGSWTERKGEREWHFRVHLCLLPDWGGHVTSHLMLLEPHLPHHDEQDVHTVN